MVQGKKQLNGKPKFAEVVIGDNEAKKMRQSWFNDYSLIGMIMDISDFSYEDFASTLSKVRIISQKYKYTCCIPGCNEITLKSATIIQYTIKGRFMSR